MAKLNVSFIYTYVKSVNWTMITFRHDTRYNTCLRVVKKQLVDTSYRRSIYKCNAGHGFTCV